MTHYFDESLLETFAETFDHHRDYNSSYISTRNMVVVVANFSDYGTPAPLSGQTEYFVHNWPMLPEGTHWHEVTQNRPVDPNWAGREAIFPWEAKVYTVVG